ncbi:MAG: ABC transporter ATP-binding protein [Elusimicrobiota bacterium]
MDPILRIRNLSVDYKVREGILAAVEGVDLDIEQGRITAVIGESGCGKSTLTAAILGITAPNAVIREGSGMLFHDRDLLRLSPKELRMFRWNEASMVFQAAQNALNPTMRIEDQFLDTVFDHDAGVSRGQAKAKVADLLRLVRLDPARVLRSYPHELSGGMRQRCVIALSLVLDPEFVLLDEPTTALDTIIQSHIFDILLDIHAKRGLTMVLVTHDMTAAMMLAHRIVIMYGGKVLETGETEEVFQRPLHPYTAGLINAIPSISGSELRCKPIHGPPLDLLNKPSGCVFHPRCPAAEEACRAEAPELAAVPGSRPLTTSGGGTSSHKSSFDRQVACLKKADGPS